MAHGKLYRLEEHSSLFKWGWWVTHGQGEKTVCYLMKKDAYVLSILILNTIQLLAVVGKADFQFLQLLPYTGLIRYNK